jgi:hypothetical protein
MYLANHGLGVVPSWIGQKEGQMTIKACLGSLVTQNQIEGEGRIALDPFKEGVVIWHPISIPPNAGGHILIQSDSFERLAFCMMATNPNAATKAFGSALHADREDVLKPFGITIERKQAAS